MRSRQWLNSASIAAAILAAACGAVLAVFWPGIIRWDSAQMIAQAHGGPISDWWSGVGTLLLRGWFSVGLGVPLIWVAIVAANIAGLFGCLRLVLARVPAACMTLALVVFPPIYGQLAGLSRDSACVGFALLAFAALATIVRTGGARRRPLLVVACASALLSAICRQNGMSTVAVVVLFTFLYDHPPTRRRIVAGAAAAVVAAAAAYAGLGGIESLAGVRSVHPERSTYAYDLAAMSVATGHDLFPQRALEALPPGGVAPTPATEAFLEGHFQTWDVTYLRSVEQLQRQNVTDASLARAETRLLRAAWLRAVENAPDAYLRERVALFAALLGLSGEPQSTPVGFYFGYQGLDNPDNFGYGLAFPGRYATATSVLELFIGNRARLPLDRPWVYLLLLAAGLAVIDRTRSRTRALVASIAFGTVLNQVLLFFTVMSAATRYEYRITEVSLVVAVYAIAAARERAWVPKRPAPLSLASLRRTTRLDERS